MKKSLIKPSVDHIENAIRTIRGEKIILDADLAELYDVETRALIQAVKRNSDRFLQISCSS
jgi:ORF6N domain